MANLRTFTDEQFQNAYSEVILSGQFFEVDGYYSTYRPRYRRTLDYVTQLPIPQPARILEVGGGQMALLCNSLFRDQCTVADVSERYAEAVRRVGVEHRTCDLIRDDLNERAAFDLIILCEVVEHLPVPLHLILQKMKRWLKPGGYFLITTPNLYRLRNILRLATGQDLFCPLDYPARGSALGHPCEFSATTLRVNLERAGLEKITILLTELVNSSLNWKTRVARRILSPAMNLRPLWRENLVAYAAKSMADDDQHADEVASRMAHSFGHERGVLP